jgi:DNA invertase Pin-like site-specific DNA recombinase
MLDTITRARAVIQSRLAELNAEARDLERALASLGEGSAPRRPRGRPKKAAATPTKAKPRAPRKRKAAKGAPKQRGRKAGRAPRGQRRDELLAAVKANPGARPSELARALGISANQVHSLIAKARAEKLLVKKDKGYALKK